MGLWWSIMIISLPFKALRRKEKKNHRQLSMFKFYSFLALVKPVEVLITRHRLSTDLVLTSSQSPFHWEGRSLWRWKCVRGKRSPLVLIRCWLAAWEPLRVWSTFREKAHYHWTPLNLLWTVESPPSSGKHDIVPPSHPPPTVDYF